MPVFGDFEEDKAILPLRIMPSDRGVPPPLPSRSTSLGPWGVGIHISEGSVHGDRAGAGAGGAGAETQNGVSTDPSPLGSPAEVSAEPWSAAKDLQSAARSLPAAGQQAVTSPGANGSAAGRRIKFVDDTSAAPTSSSQATAPSPEARANISVWFLAHAPSHQTHIVSHPLPLLLLLQHRASLSLQRCP